MNRRKFGSSVGGKISKSSVRRVACALAKFQGTIQNMDLLVPNKRD